jgi:hypothetical protein
MSTWSSTAIMAQSMAKPRWRDGTSGERKSHPSAGRLTPASTKGMISHVICHASFCLHLPIIPRQLSASSGRITATDGRTRNAGKIDRNQFGLDSVVDKFVRNGFLGFSLPSRTLCFGSGPNLTLTPRLPPVRHREFVVHRLASFPSYTPSSPPVLSN